MGVSATQQNYPRPLRSKELELLESVLPEHRAGYREYRDLIRSMIALSEGCRGAGNLVLGFKGDTADTTSPLAPVVAYGMVETTRDQYSVTIREYIGEQIDVEIVSNHGEAVPDHFEEKRRWTYSTWLPGQPSPATLLPVREVSVDEKAVLAIARHERRAWLYDAAAGMVHLIPITNFYNELVLHKNVRDPEIALKSNLLFDHLDTYTDADLKASFIAYNRLKKRIDVKEVVLPVHESGLKSFLLGLVGRKRRHE